MQDAFTTKVNTTKDLEQINTNLVINPLTVNTPITDHTTITTAAAIGYIYFDDGVTLV